MPVPLTEQVDTITAALMVRREAKPEKASAVTDFLGDALGLVRGEPDTTAWFALHLEPTTCGVFVVFPEPRGQQQHLAGQLATALEESTECSLIGPPVIEPTDVLAANLPG